MPNTTNQNLLTYSAILQRAIDNFDSIWDVITDRGLLTEEEASLKIPVSEYADYLSRAVPLFDKDGVLQNQEGLITSALYKKASDGATAITLSSISNAVANETSGKLEYTVDATISTVAYYTAGSIVQVKLPAETITDVRTLTEDVTLTDANYSVYNFGNKLYSGVKVKKGAIVTETDEIITDINTDVISNTITSLGVVSTAQNLIIDPVEEGEVVDSSNYVTFTISSAAEASGTISVTGGLTISEGYQAARTISDISSETTLNKTSDVESKTYKIPTTKIELTDSAESGKAGITTVGNTVGVFTEQTALGEEYKTEGKYDEDKIKEHYVILKPSVNDISLKGVFDSGYVIGGNNVDLGNVKVSADRDYYVKKGSVGNNNVPVGLQIASESNLDLLNPSETDEYVQYTLSIKEGSSSNVNVTPGYISNVAGISTAVLNDADKFIKVKKATGVSATAEIVNYGEDKGEVRNTSGEVTGYQWTITPEISTDTSLTSTGLVLANTDISVEDVTENDYKSHTITMSAVTPELEDISFEVTAVIDSENDPGDPDGEGTNNTVALGDLFYDENQAFPDGVDRDYFLISAGNSFSIGSGYSKGFNDSKSVVKKMPKAKIEEVTTAEGEKYFNVKYGGFLPSGVLSEISAVTPTNASVSASIVESGKTTQSFFVTTAPTDVEYYTLNLKAGNITSGYISNATIISDENAFVAPTYYLKKATISGAPSLTYDATVGILRNSIKDETDSTKEVSSNYTFTVGSQISIEGITLENPGYITSSDLNITSPEKAETTKTYTINRATFKSGVHTTELESTGTGVAEDTTHTSNYYITPSIKSCSSTFEVATPGYVTAEDNGYLGFTNDNISHIAANTDNSHVFYIKTGTSHSTENTFVNYDENTGFTATNVAAGKIDETTTGNYKIIIDGDVTSKATLDIGYYGDTEKEIVGKTEIYKEIEINHGSATVTLANTSTNEIVLPTEGVSVKLHTKVEKDALKEENTARNFTTLTAKATVSTNTEVTEGYIKNITTDKTNVVGGLVESATSYVEVYSGSNTKTVASAKTEDMYSITLGQDSSYEIDIEKDSENLAVLVATKEKYSPEDTFITLSSHAMGIDVMSKLLELEERMLGV